MSIEVHCNSCSRLLRVPDNLLGQLVRCPGCRQTFTATAPAPTAPPEPAPTEASESFREGFSPQEPPRRPRLAPEEDEEPRPDFEDEDEDRPRRRSGGRRAASLVAGPAVALIVLGVLDLIGCVLGIALQLFGVGLAASQGAGRPGVGGGPGPNMDIWIHALTIPFYLIELLRGGLHIIGGLKMKNLRGYGWALASCIVALVPTECCSWGILSIPCILLHVPFGIWGIIAINQPEVKEAFR